MDATRIIREALARVAHLRHLQACSPELAAHVKIIKAFQARRFKGTYADLLQSGSYQEAAQFFLDELYSDKDYTERDAQFERIAGTLQTLFPKQVISTAVSLAHLHTVTEELDHAMALAWQGALPFPSTASDCTCYVTAWRAVGHRAERELQLQVVQEIGVELARLTRLPGLRLMLKMMRRPAHAAGLASLQTFLESGFDTFAGMSRQPRGVEVFLSIVQERESALIRLLFDASPVAGETELVRTLGKV
jgi:hypothetical protein